MKENMNSITTANHEKDHHEVLNDLFDATRLEYLRINLWYFLKAVMSADYFRFKGQPVTVIELVGDLETLIDMFYRLLKLHEEEQELEGLATNYTDDGPEADFSHMRSLYQIHDDYHGHIRRLRMHEVENLYSMVYRFFAFCSPELWRQKLKDWQYYALSADCIIVLTDETEILEMYEHLEKLIEAAYLLYERGTMIDPGEDDDAFDDLTETNPSIRATNEGCDPMGYLCDYFSGTHLREQISDLSHWLEAAFSDRIWSIGAPAELVFFHYQTIGVLEAAFRLDSKAKCGTLSLKQPGDYRRPLPEVTGYTIYPHYLNEREQADPFVVLQELCNQPLEIYREKLKSWLYNALSPDVLDDPSNDFYFYHLFQRLWEALYLLCIRACQLETSDKPITESL